MSLENPRQLFEEKFARWGLALDDEALRRGKGRLVKQGWNVAFIVGRKGGEDYLEYYASHRMTNDRHVRIYESGKEEQLPAIEEIYSFDPNVAGDEERARTDYFERNARIAAELMDAGLFPEGDINAYLRTTPDTAGS